MPTRRQLLLSSLAASLPPSTRADPAPGPDARIAVIGHTGRGNYGHGLDTLWIDLPGAEVVAVADPDPDGLARALQRLHLAPSAGYADYHTMLAEVRADVVSIAPRHIDQHHDMILAAIHAGARGIYVEKPFCRDLVEADSIVEACREHGTRLAIAHRNSYHPVLPIISQLIADGAIGRPLELRARGKEDARGGGLDLWVLGSHVLDLGHRLAGQPVACSATCYSGARPATPADRFDGAEGTGPLAGDRLHARFEMASGLPLFFDSIKGAAVPNTNFGLQIIGTAGIIDMRPDVEPLAHLLEGNPNWPIPARRTWIPITSAGLGQPEPITDIASQIAGHHAPAADLLAAIAEGRDPLCHERHGRTVVEMTMAVFESHRLGGALVPLPLADRDHPFLRWS